MFIWDWFTGVLKYLGLYRRSGKILLLGLDNAGKTTLLSVLKEGHMTQPVPTLHPTSEELTMGGVLFTTFDLGGHQQARRIWRDYFPVVDGIVFIVDAFYRERIWEAKEEFYSVFNDEQTAEIPILILANKIDKPGAASEDEIRSYFDLDNKTTGKGSDVICDGRPLELFMCSVLKKQGYGEAFRWLAQFLK